MNYLPHIPGDERVAGNVQVMFHLDSYLPDHSKERLVPDGLMSLVIELDGRERYLYGNQSGQRRQTCKGAWLSGVHSDFITLGDTDQENCLLAIQFKPGGSTVFTHRPAQDFCDSVVPAQDVFGDGIVDLREALLREREARERLKLAEAWLVDRYDAQWSTPEHVQIALDALKDNPAAVRFTQLIEQHGTVSYRHFVSSFRRHVGPTPKGLQRILRFTSIFECLQGGQQVNWAALSLELGFSDQAHLIREFRSFSGYRPEEFRAKTVEGTNFFPEQDPS